ncbi:MAG: hypothetical protein MI806_07325 [Minwuiales bacterium]|nr:hypothetical protein [Minwuiales bacterium]
MTETQPEPRRKEPARVSGGVTVIDAKHPDGRHKPPKPRVERNMLTRDREAAEAAEREAKQAEVKPTVTGPAPKAVDGKPGASAPADKGEGK